ncbi:MAG TPA: AIR synthase-related protein, partial [Bacteroidales bacterium]|nr:AIR synthase-related protein [Bacteroidales bacterium]
RVKRERIISNHNIKPGDVIVGLASYGKTSYEDEYNGGMGSNGLTSARHDVFSTYLVSRYPESFDTSLPYEVVYTGRKRLTEIVPDLNITAGKLVLSPTRTYAPVMKEVLESMHNEIHGLVHCSGGGQTKIKHFVDNIHVVKDDLFPLPPLFRLIHEQSGTEWKEMYQVFNMGHRFEIYTDEKSAGKIMDVAKRYDLDSRIIGYCEKADKGRVTIKSEFGVFEY